MNILQRHRVREQAWDAWEQAGHDPVEAQRIFTAAQPADISPALLAMLIELAIRWFLHFREEASLMGRGDRS